MGRALKERRRPAGLALGAAVLLVGAGRLAAQSALDTTGFDRGDPKAPLMVVEFADFGCPACAEFARETWPAIDAEFVQTGRLRWKFVPFVLGAFRHAEAAARAALCAAERGAFWSMAERLYADQRGWSVPRVLLEAEAAGPGAPRPEATGTPGCERALASAAVPGETDGGRAGPKGTPHERSVGKPGRRGLFRYRALR